MIQLVLLSRLTPPAVPPGPSLSCYLSLSARALPLCKLVHEQVCSSIDNFAGAEAHTICIYQCSATSAPLSAQRAQHEAELEATLPDDHAQRCTLDELDEQVEAATREVEAATREAERRTLIHAEAMEYVEHVRARKARHAKELQQLKAKHAREREEDEEAKRQKLMRL